MGFRLSSSRVISHCFAFSCARDVHAANYGIDSTEAVNGARSRLRRTERRITDLGHPAKVSVIARDQVLCAERTTEVWTGLLGAAIVAHDKG